MVSTIRIMQDGRSVHRLASAILTRLSHHYLNPSHVLSFSILFPGQVRYAHNHPLQKTAKSSDLGANLVCSLLSNHTASVEKLLDGFKQQLSSKLVEKVLLNYKQLGRKRTLEFFSWAGIQLGFRFDDSVVEYMADFLGRRKLFDDLKGLLVTVTAYRGNISCRTVSICIRFLGRQGRVKEALCLFEEMEAELYCKPDNLVCNNMLYVLCKKEASVELIDVALKIFKKIGSPDTYSYSNILVGLCKFCRFDAALEVFGEMGTAGLVPTRSAVNSLIGELCVMSSKDGSVEKVRVSSLRKPITILVPNVACTSGAVQPAMRVFWMVHKMGILPSSFVITLLISELSRLGHIKEAVEVLKIIEERKQTCASDCYSIVLRKLCDHRMVDEACSLFKKMLSKNMKPKLVIYNSLICALTRVGSLDDAVKVYNIMQKNRCPPDNVTYTALIHGYCGAKNWEAAYKLVSEMLGLDWAPHFHTYTYVDKLLKENGLFDLCTKLERKLDVQVLKKHCKHGRLDAAYEKLKSILDFGIHPPVHVTDAFERAFQKAGKHNVALDLLKKADYRKETANSVLVSFLVPTPHNWAVDFGEHHEIGEGYDDVSPVIKRASMSK